MRYWHRRGWIGLLCLSLAGCAGRLAAITPDQAVTALQSGRPLLSCREPCLITWQLAQPQAAQLAAGRQWPELAALVLRVGYQDDLTLYYLGLAAEGIGNSGAAAGFFRQSIQLSGTAASCVYLSHQCGGVALPWAAEVALAAIDRELNQRYGRRPPRRSPFSGAAPSAEPGAVGPPAELPPAPLPPAPGEPAASEAPPPAATPSPSLTPPPLPPPLAPPPPPPPALVPSAPHGSDYIEPPPVVR